MCQITRINALNIEMPTTAILSGDNPQQQRFCTLMTSLHNFNANDGKANTSDVVKTITYKTKTFDFFQDQMGRELTVYHLSLFLYNNKKKKKRANYIHNIEKNKAGFPKLSCATDPFLRIKFTVDPTFQLR